MGKLPADATVFFLCVFDGMTRADPPGP